MKDSREYVFRSEYSDVSYLPGMNVVFVEWKTFCKNRDYREPLLRAIEVMRKYENCHYVADTRNGFKNEEEDTLWVFNDFIPRASAAGCKYIFFIISTDNKLEEELEGQSNELEKAFEVIRCYDIDEVELILKNNSSLNKYKKLKKKSMENVYLNNDFDPSKLMNVFDELPLWSAPFGLKLLEAVELKRNITAIDIGFGSGFPLTELAMRLGDSSIVYGIDPWKEAITKTKEKIDYYGIKNIKLVEGIAESIPLENNSVELITSNNGLNNAGDLEKALFECSRILKPGGQFVQTMNLDKSMFEFYTQMKHVLVEMNLGNEIVKMHEHIAKKRPSVDSLMRLLEKQGFIVRKLEYDQFNYKFIDGTTMLNHYFIRLAFMDSWASLLPDEKIDEVFSRIELKLNEYAQIAGGLNLSIPFVLIDVTKK